ncbi:KpsF/GutQ family sugar-phosphate isomerase [Photobacterium leiognathi]|uniref:KpsF/GutQ family sugar-phosphate isomerase n=1 Tax=Photobacterium leiognathi TaxID=553611 RepID=UPI001EE14900|nr:KpsF/GutQ family sugar-phosphate isomerase [Photobacterium leiognathi]MCG3886775.1 KpsF/GutQ family sugar-phosphate isomerase [Photobacterium leiognathi]
MSIVDIAKGVIKTEILGLDYMSSQIGDEFIEAVNAIISTTGRTIICGMGKSGIIGKKIAASFASTGTPSFFMHPGEAFHGDLGMVKPEDVFIAISNSGETDEVLKLLPFLRDNDNYIIAITGRPESTLAKNSHCHLNIEVPKEACPLQLAPTSSTTATLVMGDALTVALMSERNFKPENFARFHPGGSLGRRLLSKVRDEMVKDNLPVVSINDHFSTIINVISAGQLGLCLVMNKDELVGIITDGDIRRSMETYGKNVFDLLAESIVTRSPLSISPDVSIQVAYEQMHDKNVTSLVVLEANTLVGVIKK